VFLYVTCDSAIIEFDSFANMWNVIEQICELYKNCKLFFSAYMLSRVVSDLFFLRFKQEDSNDNCNLFMLCMKTEYDNCSKFLKLLCFV